MATTSKRISELTSYVKPQFDPNWQSCIIPANFFFDNPEFPDTFKVPVSSLALNFKDGFYSGVLTVLKTLSADAPLLLGTSSRRSGIVIYTGSTTNSSSYTALTRDSNSTLYTTLLLNKSWFFKVYAVGNRLSNNHSTNVEFTGLLKRTNSGDVSIVGTPTKMIHSRDDVTSDVEIQADDTTKTLTINAKGGSGTEPYIWTARFDFVEV